MSNGREPGSRLERDNLSGPPGAFGGGSAIGLRLAGPGDDRDSSVLAFALGDTDAMGFYEDEVVPRLAELIMSRRELTPIRARVAASLDGAVLEVGFGSGLNVPHYPPAVTQVRAVDPATVGRRLAAKRVASSSVPVEYVGLDGQALSQESASIDHVLTTWTLCSIPDVDRALSEIRRVLRPGGLFHFVEHGRSPDRKVAGWQDRYA